MLSLEIEVLSDRNGLARARLYENGKLLHGDSAVATADAGIASKRGNSGLSPLRPWGHPPLGSYTFLGRARTQGPQQAEYGGELFLFEPTGGSAMSAVSHGRVGLLAYAGALGADNRMRCTQGGLRLSNKMIATLQKRVDHSNCVLKISVLEQPPWWQFWKRKIHLGPLSATPAQMLAPPHDEVSLIDGLLRRFARKPVYGGTSDDMRRDEERRDDRSSFDDNRSSNSSTETFRGGGGQSGGGGASGGWDNSGRIPAGAAAGAAAALATGAVVGAAVAAAASGEFDTGGRDSGTSTSTRY